MKNLKIIFLLFIFIFWFKNISLANLNSQTQNKYNSQIENALNNFDKSLSNKSDEEKLLKYSAVEKKINLALTKKLSEKNKYVLETLNNKVKRNILKINLKIKNTKNIENTTIAQFDTSHITDDLFDTPNSNNTTDENVFIDPNMYLHEIKDKVKQFVWVENDLKTLSNGINEISYQKIVWLNSSDDVKKYKNLLISNSSKLSDEILLYNFNTKQYYISVWWYTTSNKNNWVKNSEIVNSWSPTISENKNNVIDVNQVFNNLYNKNIDDDSYEINSQTYQDFNFSNETKIKISQLKENWKYYELKSSNNYTDFIWEFYFKTNEWKNLIADWRKILIKNNEFFNDILFDKINNDKDIYLLKYNNKYFITKIDKPLLFCDIAYKDLYYNNWDLINSYLCIDNNKYLYYDGYNSIFKEIFKTNEIYDFVLKNRIDIFTMNWELTPSSFKNRQYSLNFQDISKLSDIISTSQNITKNLTTDEDKIKAVYNWINKNIIYDNDSFDKILNWERWNIDSISAIETFYNKKWVCQWIWELFGEMLKNSWIKNVEIKNWYALDWWFNFWHVWAKIWDYYYDPTYDLYNGEQTYKRYKLPKDLFYVDRIDFSDITKINEYKSYSKEQINNIIKNWYLWLIDKYKNDNYEILKEFIK